MSKALERSMKMAPVAWPLLKDENTSFVNFKRAIVVEKLSLKPDWNGDTEYLMNIQW